MDGAITLVLANQQYGGGYILGPRPNSMVEVCRLGPRAGGAAFSDTVMEMSEEVNHRHKM